MVHMEMKITEKIILKLILLSLKIQKIHFCFQIMNIMINWVGNFANRNIAQFNGLEN